MRLTAHFLFVISLLPNFTKHLWREHLQEHLKLSRELLLYLTAEF